MVYEDDDLLIVDKPAGLVVHPSPGHDSGTLVNALLGRGRGPRAGRHRRRPAARHRASPGPRHERAAHGRPHATPRRPRSRRSSRRGGSRRRTSPSSRAPWRRPSGASRRPSGATRDGGRGWPWCRAAGRRRPAIACASASPAGRLLELDLVTGRTHQIRVHLEAIGHPVAGDPLYGNGHVAPRPGRAGAPLPARLAARADLTFDRAPHPCGGAAPARARSRPREPPRDRAGRMRPAIE